MIRSLLMSLPAWLVLLTVIACHAPAPDPANITAGMNRDAILGTYGEPAGKQKLIKQNEAIWGPIETFWAQVPMGSTVEIWKYPTEGGAVELYFLDESETVKGTGFEAEGAVYESTLPLPGEATSSAEGG